MKQCIKSRVLAGVAFLLCIAVMFSYAAPPLETYAVDYQKQIDTLNRKLKEYEEKQTRIQSNINSAKTEKEKQLQTKNYLDEQISITRDEISIMDEKIALLELDIEEKQAEIEAKQAEHDQNYELFRQRVKAMYMYDDSSTLGLILGSDSFVDFLTKTDTVVRVAEHDRTLMRQLSAEKQALERDRADLEERKSGIEEVKQQAEEKRSSLTTQVNAAALKIQDIAEMEKEYNAEMGKVKAEMEAAKQEINDIYAKMTYEDFEYNGEMAWPVTGFHKITSDFGWRFGGSDYHTGIDISGAGVYGQPVRAGSYGVVKLLNYTYTPGRGYGIYVILDHGSSISTLYAHLSSIGDIKVGDTVNMGQTIGYVGSTGWSTGPHLHFEVRVKGKATDPKPYVM